MYTDDLTAAVEAEREESLFDGAAAIVTAVEAETERCAGVDPLSVGCSVCGVKAKDPCWTDGTPEKSIDSCDARWRAAIRQKPGEGEEEDGD